MASNFFFNNFSSSPEQNLIEDLIAESIKMYGIDIYYIPRKINNRDAVYREAAYSTYENAYLVEVYIKTVDGFQGDGEFLSKFGIEVRDQIVFTMSRRSFTSEVSNYDFELRPLEGDLIWLPLTQSLYQIKLADVKPIFFQMGSLQSYDLTCELYEANSDKFSTGIADIDNVYNKLTLDDSAFHLLTEDGMVLITEYNEPMILDQYTVDNIDKQAENEVFGSEALSFIDFSEFDPFSENSSGTRV